MINVRKIYIILYRNNNCLLSFIIVGNKISDKFDDLTHPGETRMQKFIRKSKKYAEEVKEDIHDTYGNIKDKYFNK